MQIDWITVAAQIINFMLLVWLLQRFLFRPIMRAVDEREARVSGTLKQAEQTRQAASDEAARFKRMGLELDENRTRLMKDAEDSADRVRQSLARDARAEVNRSREEWLKGLRDEQLSFGADVRDRLSRSFASLARRALAELADTELEDLVIARFLRELRLLEGSERDDLRAAMAASPGTLLVRTAFPMAPETSERLTVAIRKLVDTDVGVNFKQATDLICGLEMRAGGRLVKWSIDGLLEGYEQDIAELIQEKAPGTQSQLVGQP